MNYIKSFKLFESVDNILQSLDISSDDLKDIFQDLIDEGFEYKIRDAYLTKSGTKYNTNELIDNYYPTLSITLKRDINNNDDIRNWDGSYYYEDKNIIEIIHHCINRLKSTLSDQDVKILYSINNINFINIRICISEKNPDVKLNINEIKGYLDNKFGLDFQNLVSEFTEDYSIQLPPSIYIKPENNRMEEICDRICKDSNEVKPIDSDKEYTNLKDFKKIIFNIVTHLLKKFKDISKLEDWSLKDENYSDWSVRSIEAESEGLDSNIFMFYKDIPIIKVSYWTESHAAGKYKIKSGGFFKSSFYKSVKLYRLKVEVDFMV